MWRILGKQRVTEGGRQGRSGEVTGRGTPVYHQHYILMMMVRMLVRMMARVVMIPMMMEEEGDIISEQGGNREGRLSTL